MTRTVGGDGCSKRIIRSFARCDVRITSKGGPWEITKMKYIFERIGWQVYVALLVLGLFLKLFWVGVAAIYLWFLYMFPAKTLQISVIAIVVCVFKMFSGLPPLYMALIAGAIMGAAYLIVWRRKATVQKRLVPQDPDTSE